MRQGRGEGEGKKWAGVTRNKEGCELDDSWALGLSTIYPPPPAVRGVDRGREDREIESESTILGYLVYIPTSTRRDRAALRSGLTDCTNTVWAGPSTTCRPMGRFSLTVVV